MGLGTKRGLSLSHFSHFFPLPSQQGHFSLAGPETSPYAQSDTRTTLLLLRNRVGPIVLIEAQYCQIPPQNNASSGRGLYLDMK